MQKKIMVGMSGGIDSSVTAYMLQKEGYEVEGVYLKLHNRTDGYHEKNLGHIEDVAKFCKHFENIKTNKIDTEIKIVFWDKLGKSITAFLVLIKLKWF